ncbi:MAG: tetratricopeptide repeat protein, partial [Blastocatellia bacterium]
MVEFFVSNRRNRCEPAIARFAWLGALVGASLNIFCGLCIAQSMQAPSRETQMHLQRARDALKGNAPDTAINEYRAVLEMEPKNIEANANLGVMAFFQGDCAKASGYFSAVLAVQPSIPKAQALLGICEKRLGAPSAQARLEKSFSEISDPKLRIQVGTELAGLYYQKGDLQRTASLIQSLVELAPDDVDILYFGQLVYTEMADEM